jgi:hypothetical protein
MLENKISLPTFNTPLGNILVRCVHVVIFLVMTTCKLVGGENVCPEMEELCSSEKL